MSTLSEAPSDESHLSESTYDFLDTDEESHDGNGTESVASIEFGRPDDLASLADTENSDEESGDEDTHNSSIPAYGLEDSINNTFNTPTIGRNSAVLLEDSERPLPQSIEFEEPYGSLGAENVSVKHTVTDFTEEQTEAITRDVMMQNPPEHLVLTIRQTMSKQGLSTKEPLRILYVGSHSAKQDIIHKIASSVTASIESRGRSQLRSSSQLYNVVPVSAFGSEKTPEIELMHSSGYQIKVDDCISAEALPYEESPEKPTIIKLTLEDNYCYNSVADIEGEFTVEPDWELPHVAVFFCSDNDDAQCRRTRTLARKFMSRHFIPSIVISHRQLLSRSQFMSLDQHSIHMCLESRDPSGRGNLIHQRLPIDLASFLNIDARQMNRNLAYLTGLHDETFTPPSGKSGGASRRHSQTDISKPWDLQGWAMPEWRSLLPIGLLALSVLVGILTGIPSFRFSSSPTISINNKTLSTVPTSTLSMRTPSAVATITSPSTSIATTTQTVTVTQAQSSGPNSLAVLPSMELGKLQKVMKSDGKCAACTAEILGDREILIRIPTSTKLSWLTKDALSVNITRHNTTIDTERAYSTNEGIVLLLGKKEAHGVLNISVTTTRRPRINETFQVDFGTNPLQTMQDLLERFYTFFKEDTVIVDGQTLADVRVAAEKVLNDARESSQSTLAGIDEAKRLALERAGVITSQLSESARTMSLEAARRSALISHEVGTKFVEVEEIIAKQLHSLQNIREPLDEGLLKAQIRSKLLWLKMQGKETEYEDYKLRATLATQKAEAAKKLQEQEQARAAEKQKKTRRGLKKAANKESKANLKKAKTAAKKN